MDAIYYQCKLDRKIPVPLYYQLKQFMVDQIEAGVLKEGTGSLGRGALQHFECQSGHIRQAFSELETKARLRRQKAKGTFIAKPKIQGSFFQTISSFNDEMRAKGWFPPPRCWTSG